MPPIMTLEIVDDSDTSPIDIVITTSRVEDAAPIDTAVNVLDDAPTEAVADVTKDIPSASDPDADPTHAISII
jgi:hypothetical protein